MSGRTGPPERSPRRFGQNFLADPNLLEVIVREADLSSSDVVLEVGGGGGALTELLAAGAERVHVIEIDKRLRKPLERLAEDAGDIDLMWGDAMRLDLDQLEPPPNKMVSNLPYSIATPLLVRTITELSTLETWVVMVQREIADRLRAEPGNKAYGSASVLVQLACDVEFLRAVDPAVFVPRPRVASALVRLTRKASAASDDQAAVVRLGFAHRRKSLARSLELSRAGTLEPARIALEEMGKPVDTRAEALSPDEFVRFADALARRRGRP